jgi:hypothetical protein
MLLRLRDKVRLALSMRKGKASPAADGIQPGADGNGEDQEGLLSILAGRGRIPVNKSPPSVPPAPSMSSANQQKPPVTPAVAPIPNVAECGASRPSSAPLAGPSNPGPMVMSSSNAGYMTLGHERPYSHHSGLYNMRENPPPVIETTVSYPQTSYWSHPPAPTYANTSYVSHMPGPYQEETQYLTPEMGVVQRARGEIPGTYDLQNMGLAAEGSELDKQWVSFMENSGYFGR